MDSARLLSLLDSLHAHLRAAQASRQAPRELVDSMLALEECSLQEIYRAALGADAAQLTT